DRRGRLASECLKRRAVDDFAAFLVGLELHPHPQHVAAVGTADGSDGIGVIHFTEILRVSDGFVDAFLEVFWHGLNVPAVLDRRYSVRAQNTRTAARKTP